VVLGDKNVTVSLPTSGNRTLKIQFPAIGNFSASYSNAGSDIAGMAQFFTSLTLFFKITPTQTPQTLKDFHTKGLRSS
jgi:hypothetical protein